MGVGSKGNNRLWLIPEESHLGLYTAGRRSYGDVHATIMTS